jgi:hypothetical protein
VPRPVMAAAATRLVLPVVLAAVLGGCGSGSPPPSGASHAEFCHTFARLGAGMSPTEAADRLTAVGTPRDIDTSARHGFEVLVDHLRDLPNTSPGSLSDLVRDLPSEDAADVQAFVQYYGATCRKLPSGFRS